MLSKNTLYSFDMVKISSGEILTIYGNYDKSIMRVRLSFIPRIDGERIINGFPYEKARYETGYTIPQCQKILDLPGEQHFLFDRSQIVETYRASQTFAKLSIEDNVVCQTFIDIMHTCGQVDMNLHGLTGSLAVHERIESSDFDWIIYKRNPTIVEACIKSDPRFQRELTFSMEHVYRKYSVFNHLNRNDLDALFADRWKYFRYKNLLVSVSFVDPIMRADGFLSDAVVYGKRIALDGIVVDVLGCYQIPRIIPIRSNGESYKALTWLFLYNGAFKLGDHVEVAGQECIIGGERYILIETPNDYIRKVGN